LLALLEKIAELVNDKKLEGVADLRDESDRDGVRVVIELKRDAFPEIVQNNLFKKTSLQVRFYLHSVSPFNYIVIILIHIIILILNYFLCLL
jgi:DNA gyrase subunit A